MKKVYVEANTIYDFMKSLNNKAILSIIGHFYLNGVKYFIVEFCN